MTPTRAIKVAIAGLVLAGAVALLCWRIAPRFDKEPAAKPSGATRSAPRKALPIDQKIEPVRVVDLEGKPASTQDLLAAAAGKPLILAFWSIT